MREISERNMNTYEHMCISKREMERSFGLESRIGELDCKYANEYVGLDVVQCVHLHIHARITYILYTYIHIYIEICMRVIVFF